MSIESGQILLLLFEISPESELAMTTNEGGKEWMMVAMGVVLLLLVISIVFCYRQCTKQKVPEHFDGHISGTGLNQRKQTADDSMDEEDEDEENNEFVDTDEEDVLTVEITPEPVQEL